MHLRTSFNVLDLVRYLITCIVVIMSMMVILLMNMIEELSVFNEKARLLLKRISFQDSKSFLSKAMSVSIKGSVFGKRNYFLENKTGFRNSKLIFEKES